MAADPDVVPLVERCLALLEEQGPAAVDALLAAHPDQAAAVRRRLETLVAADLIRVEHGSPHPQRVGDFRLLEVIGSGGMGVVYRAEQIGLGRQVAVKLIRPDHLLFPQAKARFYREIESAARLEHPGIVPVHAAGEEQGMPYLAMELVHGATLESVLASVRGSPPEKLTGATLHEAVAIRSGGRAPADAELPATWTDACFALLAQLAAALDHAHHRGVLHRDVKPSNIMITAGGRARLLDFGLAQVEETQSLTRSGSQLGSLPYMAPEQIRGERAGVDARTDIYGAGVTLYEMLTLQAAFWAETTDATRQRILAGEIVAPRRLNRAVSREAEAVCLKAMDRDPARRYRSAAELGADLRRLLSQRPVLARRPSATLRLRRWVQRHPAMATAGALGSLLIGGLGAYAVDAETKKQALQLANSRAEDNLSDAIAAVDAILEQGSAGDVGERPADDPTSRQLLERALGLYEQLLAREEDNETLAYRVVHARARIGSLQLRLGRRAEAVPVLRAALQQCEKLRGTDVDARSVAELHTEIGLELAQALTEIGSVVEAATLTTAIADRIERGPTASHRLQLVRTWQVLAMAHYRDGAIEPAFAAVERAVRLAEDALAADPNQPRALALLAAGTQMLAYWSGFHRPDVASGPLFEKALETHRRAHRDNPAAAGARLYAARILISWAHVDTRRRAWEDALVHVREAQGILLELVDDYPLRTPPAESLLANWYQLAWTLIQTGATGAAEQELRSAVARGESVIARHADHLDLGYRLAILESELAQLLGSRPEDAAEADHYWAQAARRWELIAERSPPTTTQAQQVGTFFDKRARHERFRGRLDAARELAERACRQHRQMIARFPNNELHRSNLGKSLALLAGIEAEAGRDDAAWAALQAAAREGTLAGDGLDDPQLERAFGGRHEYQALRNRVPTEPR